MGKFKTIQPTLPLDGLKRKRRKRSSEFVPGGPPKFEDRGESSLRAVSVMQPWAWAIAHAGKDYENRTWVFPYYFLNKPFAIHASSTFHAEGYEWLKRGDYPLNVPLPKQTEFAMSAIVGIALIDRCIHRANTTEEFDNPWFDLSTQPYGWHLTKVLAIEPVTCSGSRGLWFVPHEIADSVLKRYIEKWGPVG